MAHEVKLKLHSRLIESKDIEIAVRDSSGKVGTLLISRGNIEWRPAWKSVKKFRFNWRQFADRMEEGKLVKAKRRGRAENRKPGSDPSSKGNKRRGIKGARLDIFLEGLNDRNA